MGQKISTLKDDERHAIEQELEGKSSAMGMSSYITYGATTPEQKKLKELLGMCHDCNNLNYCATEFGNVLAVCAAFQYRLHGQNRIVECNLHEPKNTLTLNEMYSMATLIDIGTDNKKVGFTAKIKDKKGVSKMGFTTKKGE